MLTMQRAVLTVLTTAASLTILGGILGGVLGAVTPGYYKQVFNLRDEVSTTELGIGLGVTQGVIWGLIIGVLLVAIMAWKETRVAKHGR